MSTLRVNQVKTALNKMFGNSVDTSDLNPNDRELATKTLTRQLAALAVLRATGCAVDVAAASVCDGTKDNGIDAMYLDPTEGEVILVQSKWISSGSGEPSSKDIRAFTDGVRDIVENDVDAFDKRIHSRLENIAEALGVIGTTIKIIVVSTGKSELAEPATGQLTKIVAKINGEDDVDEVASFEVYGLAEVYKQLAHGGDDSRIDVDATILDWSYIQSPFGAYFGTIDGVQLKELWDRFGKRLVAKNIRHSLGATDVNTAIEQTATKEPERFWYYNNGITFVADEAQRAPGFSASQKSGNFLFSGASIVNGAQTVSTLAKVSESESLGKVKVPVRIIILKDSPSDFGSSVTRTNNLQNRVEGRDFVAQDPEQTRIQNEMAMDGVEYQFLRGDGFRQTDRSCELVEVVTALACATGDASLAVQAKTGIGRFFVNLRGGPYRTLFNPSLSGMKAFNSVIVHRKIEAVIEAKRNSLERRSGATFGVLVHGNRVLETSVFKNIPNLNLEQSIETFQHKVNDLPIEELVDDLVNAYVKVIERDYPNKFLAVLFKSPIKSKTLMEAALAEYTALSLPAPDAVQANP